MPYLPSSCSEAREIGSHIYFTGRPCKQGHTTIRYTIGSTCYGCCRQNRGRWENDKQAKAKADRIRNKRAATKARRRTLQRTRYARLKDTPEFRVKAKENYRKTYRKDPKAALARTAARCRGLKQRTPAWADKAAIKQFYRACPPGYEVDHVIPLRGKNVSGLHIVQNLQYLPPRANRSKGAAFLVDPKSPVC